MYSKLILSDADIMRQLLEAGADVNLPVTDSWSGVKKVTALHLAVSHAHSESISILRAAGSKVRQSIFCCCKKAADIFVIATALCVSGTLPMHHLKQLCLVSPPHMAALLQPR